MAAGKLENRKLIKEGMLDRTYLFLASLFTCLKGMTAKAAVFFSRSSDRLFVFYQFRSFKDKEEK